MRLNTAIKLAQGMQLFELDGIKNYTIKDLASITGVSAKTIGRQEDIINIINIALDIDAVYIGDNNV